MLAGVLYSGQPFIAATTHQVMLSVLRYHLLFWIMTRINEWVSSRRYGYWLLRRRVDFITWISLYLTRAIFWELWAKPMGWS